MLRVIVSLVAICWSVLAVADSGCGQSRACPIDGSPGYRIAPPPDWDGQTPIGALVFFHGHRSSAEEMLQYRELVDTAHALGLMLVAAQGAGESWSTAGSPSDGRRDELAFVRSLTDDLTTRFKVDRRRLVASGFSQGASVVWEIACHGDGRFAAFLPIAGVWWRPMPTTCTAPLRPLLHIHGETDPVMPMAGRSLRDRWRQGDVTEAIATQRRLRGCPVEAPVIENRGPLACRFDTGCASGQPLALCLHGGDHHINPAWLMAVKDWLQAALKP